MKNKLIAIATIGLILQAGNAFAGSFETGVRNRYQRSTGTYKTEGKVNFSERTVKVSGSKWVNATNSVKIDVVAPGPASVTVKLDKKGRITASGSGRNVPRNPDPTAILVNSKTLSTGFSFERTDSKANGYQKSSSQGREESGLLEGSSFINN